MIVGVARRDTADLTGCASRSGGKSLRQALPTAAHREVSRTVSAIESGREPASRNNSDSIIDDSCRGNTMATVSILARHLMAQTAQSHPGRAGTHTASAFVGLAQLVVVESLTAIGQTVANSLLT